MKYSLNVTYISSHEQRTFFKYMSKSLYWTVVPLKAFQGFLMDILISDCFKPSFPQLPSDLLWKPVQKRAYDDLSY